MRDCDEWEGDFFCFVFWDKGKKSDLSRKRSSADIKEGSAGEKQKDKRENTWWWKKEPNRKKEEFVDEESNKCSPVKCTVVCTTT